MNALMFIVHVMESIVKDTYPDSLQVWPTLRSYDGTAHLTDEHVILVIRDKIQGDPCVGLSIDKVSFHDLPTFSLTTTNCEIYCNYLIKKFQLTNRDFAVVIPLSHSDSWKQDYAGLPKGILEHLHWQLAIFANRYNLSIPEKKIVNNVVTTGDNNKVLVNSIDNSINIKTDSFPEVFQELRAVLDNVKDISEREAITQSIVEMEESVKTEGFAEKYNNFISVAASHLTIFASMLPALSQLLVP